MPDILHRVGIDARPERVFKTLTTIDGLSGWWVSQTTGDPGVGGTIDFGFCQMRVLEAVPTQRVRWRCIQGPDEWVGTEVSFALTWKQEQTFILFKHADWKEPVEFMHHCSTKWATFLLSLRDMVEKADGHPVPRDIKIHVGD
ncbi:MAG TPA: SRPBCC domain-containing protein [Burkholderiaceae bacterium]|nr:SRPBCC domain-containing protein [Burkholderiaceae bacterium]